MALELIKDVAFDLLYLVSAPSQDSSMLWEVLPIIVTALALEFYFAKHKEEELGWNSAYTNGLVLIFVGANLMRFVFENDLVSLTNARFWATIGVLLVGFLLAVMDYFHVLPKVIAFKISSKLFLNYLAYIAIVYVHLEFVWDTGMMIAIVALFIILAVFFYMIKKRGEEHIPIEGLNTKV